MSSESSPARTPASRYTVPTRNATILGYGAPRPDGRLSERRRPSSIGQGNEALRNYAMSIPHGTGSNLTDQDLMILCFLSHIERHKRATKVFNNRGEWRSEYSYMTTKDDAFLASVSMPRLCVPRTLCDRPTRRNQSQVALEEAAVARHDTAIVRPGHGVIAPIRFPSVFTSHSPTSSASDHLIEGRSFTFEGSCAVEVTLVSEYSETKALEYLLPNTPASMLALQVRITFDGSYEALCANILLAFRVYLSGPYTADFYVGDLFLEWLDPESGLKESKEIFAHNWSSEIVPFLALRSDLVQHLSLRFGLYVVDKWDYFGNLIIEDGEVDENTDEEIMDIGAAF